MLHHRKLLWCTGPFQMTWPPITLSNAPICTLDVVNRWVSVLCLVCSLNLTRCLKVVFKKGSKVVFNKGSQVYKTQKTWIQRSRTSTACSLVERSAASCTLVGAILVELIVSSTAPGLSALLAKNSELCQRCEWAGWWKSSKLLRFLKNWCGALTCSSMVFDFLFATLACFYSQVISKTVRTWLISCLLDWCAVVSDSV